MIDCQEKQKIHFIGIGGIGMSALARFYLAHGCFVSGSDVAESEIIESLRSLGVKIPPTPPLLKGGEDKKSLLKGGKAHRKENLPPDTDLVVYSAAVESKNHELKEAYRRKIRCQTYAQALGELTKKYFTIAVSGTHGKSTTTAMIALILIEAGLDPTVIVGTKLREFGNSNFRMGKGKYLIIEADEYNASFLNYWPKIIVLTNIEEDHLDYYKNLGHIKETFAEYINHLGKGGVLVANGDDKNIQTLLNPKSETRNQKEIQNSPASPELGRGRAKFKIQNYSAKLKIKGIRLIIPGQHNLMNAYAAITVARTLNISDRISLKALNNFSGTWRRFEFKGEINGAKVFDDYGHHPTEIKATLQGAREYLFKNSPLLQRGGRGDFSVSNKIPPSPPFLKGGGSRLWCVFQPHQYQRTYQLFNQFASAFGKADRVILLPIYSVAGREKTSIIRSVSSQKLAQAIRKSGQDVLYLDSFEKVVNYLRKNLKKGDIAVIMGAGDIYKLTEKLLD